MTIKPIQDLNPQPALARMCYSATVFHSEGLRNKISDYTSPVNISQHNMET